MYGAASSRLEKIDIEYSFILKNCLLFSMLSGDFYSIISFSVLVIATVPCITLLYFTAGNLLPALLLATVQMGAMSGLITAAVIKKLDNIVKIYSQSLTGEPII